MLITRVVVDQEGETHFQDVRIPLEDKGIIGWLSKRFPVKEIIFRENTADYNWDFHNTPEKQFVIILSGAIEIEVSDGEVRRFHDGAIVLLEDTHGKGHRTTNISGKTRRSLFIPAGELDFKV